jgi:micrococcal nuclease
MTGAAALGYYVSLRMPRRIHRDSRSQLVYVILVLLFIGLSWWLEPYLPTNDVPTRSPGALDNGVYEVLRVVDGDTLLLKKDQLRVRLQGVDTPETVKEFTAVQDWGPEATNFTERFIKDAGMKVDITVDGEGVDQYGRHLAFVWHDGRLLNEELIANGLARAKLGYDYSQRMKDRLRTAQDKARRQKLGIWSQ